MGTGAGFRSNLHGSQMPNYFVNCQETEESESPKLAGTGRRHRSLKQTIRLSNKADLYSQS